MNPSPRRVWFVSLWFLSLVPVLSNGGFSQSAVPRFRAVDAKEDFATDDRAMFARPVYLAFASGRLHIVDAEEAAVSVFNAQGHFLSSVGRQGRGPGELDFPTAAWPDGGGILVSDGRQRRIVRFDARGRERGTFRLAFFPETILPLAGARVLVASNPGGQDRPGAILHCYTRAGRLLWQALKPAVSGDRVADTLANVVILLGGGSDDIFVVFRNRAAGIRRFSSDGRDLGEIRIGRDYPVRRVERSIGRGRTVRAEVFCWHASYDEGRFFLLVPGRTEDRDLGPGSEVYIAGCDGRISGVIELPERVTKIAASAGRLYAIDLDYRLRVMRVEKK